MHSIGSTFQESGCARAAERLRFGKCGATGAPGFRASFGRRRAEKMDFRILGPLEVLDKERVLDVGGGKQRSILALLLMHANEVVPSDRLIDELWPDAPPPTAAKIVQAHVSRLRKALDGSGEGILLTRGHGYLLHVEPGQLDVERFRRLLDARRSPTSPTTPSPRRASLDSRSCASRHSRSASTPTSPLVGTTPSFRSSSSSLRVTHSASACADS